MRITKQDEGKGIAGLGGLMLFVIGASDKGSSVQIPQRKQGVCHPTISGMNIPGRGNS